jgi:TfoX/Sxy family transcriptional regulator of competence genes
VSPSDLSAKLEAAALHLPRIEKKRMPGGYALFVAGKIFANITIEGRIGVKLTMPWAFEDLAARPGSGSWVLGQKVMEHWVLLPEALAASDDALREWVERAHACAVGTLSSQRPVPVFEAEPLTTRSVTNGAANGASPAPKLPSPKVVEPAVFETPPLPPSYAPNVPSSRRRSLVPASPSSRPGIDLSSYAPPPPSRVGIRVVPKDSKSLYEETLVGVPAPSSSKPNPGEDDDADDDAGENPKEKTGE